AAAFDFLLCIDTHGVLHPSPTRRPSDLIDGTRQPTDRAALPGGIRALECKDDRSSRLRGAAHGAIEAAEPFLPLFLVLLLRHLLDRKSTRLNSSHVKNSYAVSCLKQKRS